jgi:hypothetical protein
LHSDTVCRRGELQYQADGGERLKVIPVVSKKVQEMSDKKLNGQAFYQLHKCNLKVGGMFVNPGEASTTPLSVLAERRRCSAMTLTRLTARMS